MNFFGGPWRKIKLSKNFCIVHDAVVLDKGIASTNFVKSPQTQQAVVDRQKMQLAPPIWNRWATGIVNKGALEVPSNRFF